MAGVADDVLQMFQSHNWPGNVRELRNTMERGVIVCDGNLLDQRHLPPNFGSSGRDAFQLVTAKASGWKWAQLWAKPKKC